MPTIVNSTDGFNKIHSKFKEHFQDAHPSFHNLLWQIIINEVHDEKVIAFHPVMKHNELMISIVEFDKPGYMNTHVCFIKTDYSKAVDICNRMNVILFGILPKLSNIIVMSSMKKPKREKEEIES